MSEFLFKVGAVKGARVLVDHQATFGPFEGRLGGYRMVPAKKGSVLDGVRWLQNCDIKVHPRCKTMIHEFKHYSFKVDRATGIPDYSKFEPGNDHAIDALRYAAEDFVFLGGKKALAA